MRDDDIQELEEGKLSLPQPANGPKRPRRAATRETLTTMSTVEIALAESESVTDALEIYRDALHAKIGAETAERAALDAATIVTVARHMRRVTSRQEWSAAVALARDCMAWLGDWPGPLARDYYVEWVGLGIIAPHEEEEIIRPPRSGECAITWSAESGTAAGR